MESEIGEPSYLDGFARVDYAWSPGHARQPARRCSPATRPRSPTRPAPNTRPPSIRTPTSGARSTHDWSARTVDDGDRSRTRTSRRNARPRSTSPADATGAVDDERDYDVLGLKLDAQLRDRPLAAARGRRRAQTRSHLRLHGQRATSRRTIRFPALRAQDIARALAPNPSGEHFAAYYTVRGRLTDPLTAEVGLRWDEQTYGADADDQLGAARQSRLARRRAHAPARELGPLPAVPGHRGTAGRGRRRRVLAGAERGPPDPRARARPRRRAMHCASRPTARTTATCARASRACTTRSRWRRNCAGTVSRIAPYSALAEGGELLLTRKPVDAWSGWFGYAWSRVDRRSRRRRRPAQLGPDPHRQPGRARGRSGPWQATLAAQYHTGWPVDADRVSTRRATCVLGERNAARYADYGSLDAARELRVDAAARHADAARRSRPTRSTGAIPAAPISSTRSSTARRRSTASCATGCRSCRPSACSGSTSRQPTPCLRNQARHAAQPAAASSARKLGR